MRFHLKQTCFKICLLFYEKRNCINARKVLYELNYQMVAVEILQCATFCVKKVQASLKNRQKERKDFKLLTA